MMRKERRAEIINLIECINNCVTRSEGELKRAVLDLKAEVDSLEAELKKKDKLVREVSFALSSHPKWFDDFIKIYFDEKAYMILSANEIQYCDYCGAVNQEHDADCVINNITKVK